MKGKKLIAVIITLLFVSTSVVGCAYSQAVFVKQPQPTTAPTAASTEAPTPAPTTTPTPEVTPAPTEAAEEGAENVVYISASKLKVRESADAKAKALDSLIKGAAVSIIEEVKDSEGKPWYKVGYDSVSGKAEGYVAAEFTVKDRTELLSVL
jgi:flagellar basal body-associated protein FliL